LTRPDDILGRYRVGEDDLDRAGPQLDAYEEGGAGVHAAYLVLGLHPAVPAVAWTEQASACTPWFACR
jgi:hypothetical protein